MIGIKTIIKNFIFLPLLFFRRTGATILMYHSVGENGAFFTVTPGDFKKQLFYLKLKANYNVIFLSELIKKIKRGEPTENCVCITFDDGYIDNYGRVFPLLKELNLSATIFISTEFIDKSITGGGVSIRLMSEANIKEMSESGFVEFMPHTDNHRILTEISEEEAIKEIENSRGKLQKITGKKANILAYPKGKFNDKIIFCLKNNGWLGAVTVKEGSNKANSNVFTLKRNSIDSSTTFIQFKVKCAGTVKLYEGAKKIAKSIKNTTNKPLIKFSRWLVKSFFYFLPAESPRYIYDSLMQPAVLRNFFHVIIKKFIPKSVIIPEAEIFLNNGDIVSAALSFGNYEKFQTALFKKTVKKGMTVIDAGAHIGYYTLIAAKLVGLNGRVLAFEPNSENFKYLQKNILNNNFRNTVGIKLALSDKDGDDVLHLVKDNLGKHTIITPQNSREFIGAEKVKTVILDKFLEKNNIGQIDVIKMDIEGAESAAIRGAIKTLQNHKPILFLEFSPHSIARAGSNPLAFLDIIEKIGYDIYNINERVQKLALIQEKKNFAESFKGNRYTNLFCVPKN